MELGLAGKSAIVTGAASGIGRETARVLASEGARVLVADRDASGAERVVSELAESGGEATAFEVDVSRYEGCRGMAAAALESFGRIDALVCCAGVYVEKLFLETEPEDWRALVDVNFYGVMNASRAVAGAMAEQRSGAIVHVASDAGKIGERRMAVYAATKGAVIAFSKALAVELGRSSVRVNAVCPGMTRTPMTASLSEEQLAAAARQYPLGRLGEPRDLADTIAFLLSERATWVTGQAISVNGGYARS